jgi:hypothetical protein
VSFKINDLMVDVLATELAQPEGKQCGPCTKCTKCTNVTGDPTSCTGTNQGECCTSKRPTKKSQFAGLHDELREALLEEELAGV